MAKKTLTPESLDNLFATPSKAPASLSDTSNPHLFRLLSKLNRAELDSLLAEECYKRGELVFEEGATGETAYIIWSGQAVVLKGDLSAPTILGYRGPGEIIGEMALIEDRPRSASIIALSDLRLLRINRQGFETLLDYSPAIGLQVMASMSARLREADTVRDRSAQSEARLAQEVTSLKNQEHALRELQHLREETTDLIIHDLRNPLGLIQGTLQMLDMVLPEDVKDTNQELLDIARTACGRMTRLVNALLDTARMESGEVALSPVALDVCATLHSVANQAPPTLERIGTAVIVACPAGLPPAQADAEKVERVLFNLLDNAIKYTPPGGTITLAAEMRGETLHISVTDTGPGIPPEEQERIFERFTQVRGDQLAHRGYGLGLRFCKLAVEAHGGHIWVEPGPDGQGSRFVFTLPAS